jgi:hypothetical protein
MEQMKLYVGFVEIKAKPLNLGDYNELKEEKLPPEEDPTVEGYLVEYNDGTTSWIQKKQFEEKYQELKTKK